MKKKTQPEKDEIQVYQAKIAELIPDDKNFNKGTEYGQKLLEDSMRKFGAGRSVLLDKNNRLIGGNKATETAGAIDINDVIVVETDGTKLVAVKRTDIDLDTARGREMAFADNAVGKANLSWDEKMLLELSDELGFDTHDWGVDLNISDNGDGEEPPENLDGQSKNNAFVAKLTFPSSDKLQSFIKMYTDELSQQYGCTISVSGGEL